MKEQFNCLVGNDEENREEARRAELSKGQRERRKVRMKEITKNTVTVSKTTTRAIANANAERTTKVEDPE